MASGTVLSAGCVGNRVYTGLKDDGAVPRTIPGARLVDVIEQLSVTESANTTLAESRHLPPRDPDVVGRAGAR